MHVFIPMWLINLLIGIFIFIAGAIWGYYKL